MYFTQSIPLIHSLLSGLHNLFVSYPRKKGDKKIYRYQETACAISKKHKDGNHVNFIVYLSKAKQQRRRESYCWNSKLMEVGAAEVFAIAAKAVSDKTMVVPLAEGGDLINARA